MLFNRRLFGVSAMAAGAILGLALASAPQAQALTISFTANEYSKQARTFPAGTTAYQQLPPGALPAGVSDNEAFQVQYQTSGLPYYVSKVVYTAAPGDTFSGGAGTITTLAGFFATAGGSVNPAAPAVPTASTITQVFSGPPTQEFAQGLLNSMDTFVKISNGGLEEVGVPGAPFGPDKALTSGAMIDVFFTLIPGPGTGGLPASFDLSARFGVDTTPGDPNEFNVATTGGNTNLNVVPEPSASMLLLCLGISGSGLLLRRRR